MGQLFARDPSPVWVFCKNMFLVLALVCFPQAAEANLYDKHCLAMIDTLNQEPGGAEISKIDVVAADYQEGNLRKYKLSKKSDVLEWNETHLQALEQPLPKSNTKLATDVTQAQATKIAQDVNGHPVVGYERANVEYNCQGLCFAYGVVTHHELLRHEVDPGSIRKAFLVGTMVTEVGGVKKRWHMHTATIVKAKGKGWFVVDPNFVQYAYTVREWYEHYAGQSPSGKLQLFVTDPRRMLVADPVHYHPINMIAPDQRRPGEIIYKGFMKDYFDWAKDQKKPKSFKRS